MEYFKLLHLDKEPFSNSPDPAFFYASRQHKDCMQKLEIAVRLRRGLNVVVGEVGTGKTTLCRQLIQAFSHDPRISAFLVLDPDFQDPHAFLCSVVHMMTGRKPATDTTLSAMKETLKHYLFQTGVEEDRTAVLIVDEGQKMPPACLETLRELLNFETNEYKLLQIVIFAQNEFAGTLNSLPNLADRINLYYRLPPLSFRDFRALIHHRIRNATNPEAAAPRLFSAPALWRIHRASGGYPRKIIHLCHQCLLATIIQNKTVAGWRIAGACSRRTFAKPRTFRPVPVTMAALILAVIGFGMWQYSHKPEHDRLIPDQNRTENTVLATTSPEQIGSGSVTALPDQGPAEALPSSPTGASAVKDPVSVTTASKTTVAEIEPVPAPFGKSISEDIVSGETPSVLGSVPVSVGDTLGGLVQKVYGVYTYHYHQAVMAANPQLTDPDSLQVGQSLYFPALSADTGDEPDTTWWVSLSREPNLETAVARLRGGTAEGPSLRLLAMQRHGEELSFRIVLKTCFGNQSAAELTKNDLKPSASMTPEVFCLKKTEEIVYGSIDI